MSLCPTDDELARLLADALSTDVHAALVQHVETCAACQASLARLTEIFNQDSWRRAKTAPQFSDAEEAMLQRWKRLRASSSESSGHAASPTVALPRGNRTTPRGDDAQWPNVPGFEILGVLGRGGMGVVYKATQIALQRVVALKMVRDWTNAREKELIRFRAEAEVIAQLHHPNIVQIFDVGAVENRPYFVLEYVAGGSLAEYLAGTPQPARQAAQFVEILARAVEAAHANGVVHRDLKPGNILLVFADRDFVVDVDEISTTDTLRSGSVLNAIPKIADFGVAKRASGDWETKVQDGLTATGDFLGTPCYMAPAQATPSGPSVGPSADVYALGAILYELLTGRPPFKGATQLDTVLQLLHNEPVPVTDLQPNVPQDLETICLKCLRKEPYRRYLSANELADDIQCFLAGKPIKARPRGAIEKVWRWIRDHPLPSGLVAAGVLAPIAALMILSLLSARLVRSSALESAAQQAELLEHANNQNSLIVQRVEQAHYPVNKMFPPTPGTVPLSIPATFLHDVGEELQKDNKTGIQVRQFSDYPFPWRTNGGPHDDFERTALAHLRQTKGHDAVHDFTEIDGEPVVRYAQARIMKQSCVDCHNTHPLSSRKDWKVGDVRGVLEIIRPLKNDETRITEALQLTLFLSAIGSGLLLLGSVLAVWTKSRRIANDS